MTSETAAVLRVVGALTLLLSIASCGLKGDLYLPTEQREDSAPASGQSDEEADEESNDSSPNRPD